MSFTGREYIIEAIARGGRDFGIRVPITSLTNTTAVCAVLALGEPQGTYERQYMTRLEGADPAVRDRQVSAFDGTTGTFTQAGATYSADTTATNEYLWISEFPPNIVLRALQQTIQNLRYVDTGHIPTYKGSRYWLRQADWPWITDRSKVLRVAKRNSPQLTRNRYMQKWGTVSTGGVLTPPDSWTLSGVSATVLRIAQATSNLRKGAYVARLTRSTNNCTLGQVMGTLPSGADLSGTSGESLVGETVTAVLVCSTTQASFADVRILCDNSAVATSSTHTGGGEPEELTASATVPAGTKYLELQIRGTGADASVDIHECYLIRGAISDAVRRDEYPEQDLQPRWYDGNPLSFEVGNYGLGSQLVIETSRPYPGFDPTRLLAGNADGDSSDAPLVPVSVGMMARVFEAMKNQDPKFAALALEWMPRAQVLARDHALATLSATGGVNIPRPQNLAGARRLAR